MCVHMYKIVNCESFRTKNLEESVCVREESDDKERDRVG